MYIFTYEHTHIFLCLIYILSSLRNPEARKSRQKCVPEKVNAEPLWRDTPSPPSWQSRSRIPMYKKNLLHITPQPKMANYVDMWHLQMVSTETTKRRIQLLITSLTVLIIYKRNMFIMLMKFKTKNSKQDGTVLLKETETFQTTSTFMHIYPAKFN